jgi:uncharacterized repeat protein (TIGR02543 family)
VTYNETATEPENFDSTRQHYVFGGWYTDSDFEHAYSFSTPVTNNLVLYAKWTEREYHVAYADENDYTLENKWYTYTKLFIQNSIRTPQKE